MRHGDARDILPGTQEIARGLARRLCRVRPREGGRRHGPLNTGVHMRFVVVTSELGQDLLLPRIRHAKQWVALSCPHAGDAPALFPRQPSAISGASWAQTLWPLPAIFSSSPASWPHLVLSERSRRPPEPPVHAWCCRHCYGCQEHENRDATNDRRPQPKSLLVRHGISSTIVQWLNSMLVLLPFAGSSTPMIATVMSALSATTHHAAHSAHPRLMFTT